MALTFYDSNGRAYAYCDDGESIYTFTGRPIAYLNGESVYSYSGAHLAYYRDGLVRDNAGDVVLFTEGASGGPVKPIKQIKPIKGIRQIKPIKGIRAIKPIRPINTLKWSQYTPEELF